MAAQDAELASLMARDTSQSQASQPAKGRLGKTGLGLLWAGSLVATAVVFRQSGPTPLAAMPSEAVSLSEAAPTDCFWDIWKNRFSKAKYVDLTHALDPAIPLWPGFAPISVKAGVVGHDQGDFADPGEEWTYAKHGFQTTAYSLTTDQLGTQLDPPAHWNEFGATSSDLPATFAVRPLVVINIEDKVAKDPGYSASVEDLDAWEAKHERIPEGSVVFFRSGWGKGWQKYKEDPSSQPAKFPGVSLEVLKKLHLERKIMLHGHEPLDTDMTPSLEGEAWLMHKNFAQAEGVANLDKVPPCGCLVSIGFVKARGGSGGPARFVAICPPDSSAEGVTVAEQPGAPLDAQTAPLRRGKDGVLTPTEGAVPTEYCKEGNTALGCYDTTPAWQ